MGERTLVRSRKTLDYAHLPHPDRAATTLCGQPIDSREPTSKFLQCGACYGWANLKTTPEKAEAARRAESKSDGKK